MTRSVKESHAERASFRCCTPSLTVWGPNWNVHSPCTSSVGVDGTEETNFLNVAPVLVSFSSLIVSMVASNSGFTSVKSRSLL